MTTITGISGIKEKLSSVTTSITTKMPKCLQGTVGDTAVFQNAAYKSTLALNAIRGSAVEGSTKFALVNGAKNFLGRMGTVAKGIPVVGAALSVLCEVPNIIEGFKEGRGAAQIMKSGAAASGVTIGSIVGGAVGTLIPIPGMTFVGGAIGAMVGGWFGDKVGGGIWGSNKGTTQEQAQPATVAVQQPHAQFGSKTLRNGAVAPIPFDFNNPYAGIPPLYS